MYLHYNLFIELKNKLEEVFVIERLSCIEFKKILELQLKDALNLSINGNFD